MDGEVPARGRRRALWALALGLGLLAVAAAAGAVWIERRIAALGPPPLPAPDATATVVADREGRLLRAFTTPDGLWRLPVERAGVDPRFVEMLIAYEDRRFRAHAGVDPLALLRAAGQFVLNGRIVSGGSTLTMQVARLIEPRPERSLAAKWRQILRAVQIERLLPKDEILDLYLRLAPYGGNLEGVRAASFAWFGKEPARLSNAEAALLVALPQSPEARRPDRFPQAARAARARVLERAVAASVVPPEEGERALAEAVPDRRQPFPMLAAHAAEQAVAALPERRNLRLTLDATLQASLERLARERAEAIGPRISAAIVVVDNETGEVRARVGSADYLSAARAGAVDMTRAIRSPGSTLKPLIYALAFENGIAHPETVLDDRPSRWGLWSPENFDLAFHGTVTARRALQLSLNVPAVEVLAEVGAMRFLARMRAAGLDVRLPKETTPGLAIGLGGVGISLIDLTRLYAGFARQGLAPVLQERLDVSSAPSAPEGGRVTDPVAAWYVADILKDAPPPANAATGLIAFKTGTSYGYRDAFAIGFDRRYTVGVWLGRADGSAVPGLVGRLAAAPMLFDAFARLGGAPRALPRPRDALVATTASLPPPLRHLRKDAPKTLAAAARPPLRIAFPPDGARVDLGLTGAGAAERGALALKITGGAPPFTWLVNGRPVEAGSLRREGAWTPDGAGFVRVSVIDGRGESDSVTVRLE